MNTPWLITVRNFLFPVFSEINYLGLFWCTLLIFAVQPDIALRAVQQDGRAVIFMAGIAYVSARMLTHHQFGYAAKAWITASFYGFLSFIAVISLINQIEISDAGSIWDRINIILTGAYLAIAAIRFLTTFFIFKVFPKYKGFLIERFSDDQYNLVSILILGIICAVTLGFVSQNYSAIETILLLTYLYSTLIYKTVLAKFAFFSGNPNKL